MIPLTVDWLIWSYDVHVATLRLVQPPLDVRVMPWADSCEAACASVSLVTACAGDATSATNISRTAPATAAAAVRAGVEERCDMTTPDPSRSWTDPENVATRPRSTRRVLPSSTRPVAGPAHGEQQRDEGALCALTDADVGDSSDGLDDRPAALVVLRLGDQPLVEQGLQLREPRRGRGWRGRGGSRRRRVLRLTQGRGEVRRVQTVVGEQCHLGGQARIHPRLSGQLLGGAHLPDRDRDPRHQGDHHEEREAAAETGRAVSGHDATQDPLTFVQVGGSPLWSIALSMQSWNVSAYDGP